LYRGRGDLAGADGVEGVSLDGVLVVVDERAGLELGEGVRFGPQVADVTGPAGGQVDEMVQFVVADLGGGDPVRGEQLAFGGLGQRLRRAYRGGVAALAADRGGGVQVADRANRIPAPLDSTARRG